MAMTYVHICDVCGYRLEDTCNDEVPKGWFKMKNVIHAVVEVVYLVENVLEVG